MKDKFFQKEPRQIDEVETPGYYVIDHKEFVLGGPYLSPFESKIMLQLFREHFAGRKPMEYYIAPKYEP